MSEPEDDEDAAPELRPAIDPEMDEASASEFNAVFAALYQELKRLAAYFRSSRRNATMSATELVGATYLKLHHGTGAVAARDELHLKRLAARAMQQILIDAARRRGSERHGGLLHFVSMTCAEDVGAEPNLQVLDLHRSVVELRRVRPRHAEIVEMRYFGGFTVEEIRRYFGLSDATIERDTREALAWLRVTLDRQRGNGG